MPPGTSSQAASGGVGAAAEPYERAVAPARRKFAASPVLQSVLAAGASQDRLLAFLLQFCSLGVAMTAPVADWIRRSGERCVSLGYAKLGRALIEHAGHEQGHDALMIADAHALAALWNRQRGVPVVDPATLLSREPSPGVRRYHELHEATIAGGTPYAQIAIEYEIERLSVVYGERLVRDCARQMGPQVLDCLSFLREHVKLDLGHTAFNENRLSEFLADEPQACGVLAAAGASSLDAYAEYLSDCMRASRELASASR